MCFGTTSICYTWHIVEYSYVLIFKKEMKEGRKESRMEERKEGKHCVVCFI